MIQKGAERVAWEVVNGDKVSTVSTETAVANDTGSAGVGTGRALGPSGERVGGWAGVVSLLQVYEEDGRRNSPYEPRMMVKVLIYAYATGMFSSRKIAKKLEEDVAFRMRAAGNIRSIGR